MRFRRLDLHQFGVLTIRGAQPEDAGNYTCLATNEAGTASQSVSLTFAGESTSRTLTFLIRGFYNSHQLLVNWLMTVGLRNLLACSATPCLCSLDVTLGMSSA